METSSISYALNLEKKLIMQFKQRFFDKLGYYPIVLSQSETFEDKIPPIPLYKLKELFNPHLPHLAMSPFTAKKVSLDMSCRQRPIVELRSIYCYIGRNMGYSLKAIGQSLNRDHTTVINSLTSFKNLMETQDYFPEVYNAIFKDIRKNVIPELYESSTMDNTTKTQFESEPALLS